MPKVHGFVLLPENKLIIVAEAPQAEDGKEVKIKVLTAEELDEIETAAEKRGREKFRAAMDDSRELDRT